MPAWRHPPHPPHTPPCHPLWSQLGAQPWALCGHPSCCPWRTSHPAGQEGRERCVPGRCPQRAEHGPGCSLRGGPWVRGDGLASWSFTTPDLSIYTPSSGRQADCDVQSRARLDRQRSSSLALQRDSLDHEGSWAQGLGAWPPACLPLHSGLLCHSPTHLFPYVHSHIH